jgi:hypothetical protein
MGNRGADEVIRLGKSWHVLQSPGLGCDGVVCIHPNYSITARTEITWFRIRLCGLELSSLKHNPGTVFCKHGNAPTGCIKHNEFPSIIRLQGLCSIQLITLFVVLYLILFLLKRKYLSPSRYIHTHTHTHTHIYIYIYTYD